MKKYTALLLILILFSVWLTACGNTSGPKTDTRQSSPQPSTQASPEPAETVQAADSKPKEAGLFEVRSAGGMIDLPDLGMKITLPESVKDIPISVIGYVQHEFAIADLCLTDVSGSESGGRAFAEILAYTDKRSHDSIIKSDSGLTEDMIVDLGSNDALNYYALRLDKLRESSPETFEKLTEGLSDEQKQQYEALLDALPDMLGGVELTEVVLPAKPEEPIMDLTMPDLDGNEVRLGDLIAENKVTMLNAWGITCGPCIMEMPYLARLREKYKGQGFEIIGLTSDLLDSDGSISPKHLDEAKELAARLGVDYPVLAATRDVLSFLKVFVVPTTWFVNSSGQVIGNAVMGSRSSEQWEQMIGQALAAVE